MKKFLLLFVVLFIFAISPVFASVENFEDGNYLVMDLVLDTDLVLTPGVATQEDFYINTLPDNCFVVDVDFRIVDYASDIHNNRMYSGGILLVADKLPEKK